MKKVLQKNLPLSGKPEQSNKKTGDLGEQLARNYLVQKGHKLLFKNFRSRYGEIDIITENKNTLYFWEVKTRKGFSYGTPFESVNKVKISRIRRTVSAFLFEHKLVYGGMMMGVIGIVIFPNDKEFSINEVYVQ